MTIFNILTEVTVFQSFCAIKRQWCLCEAMLFPGTLPLKSLNRNQIITFRSKNCYFDVLNCTSKIGIKII